MFPTNRNLCTPSHSRACCEFRDSSEPEGEPRPSHAAAAGDLNSASLAALLLSAVRCVVSVPNWRQWGGLGSCPHLQKMSMVTHKASHYGWERDSNCPCLLSMEMERTEKEALVFRQGVVEIKKDCKNPLVCVTLQELLA